MNVIMTDIEIKLDDNSIVRIETQDGRRINIATAKGDPAMRDDEKAGFLIAFGCTDEEEFRKQTCPLFHGDYGKDGEYVIHLKKNVKPTPPLTDNNYKIEDMKKGIKAFGKFKDTKNFTVLKGSTVSNKLDKTFGYGAANGACNLRKELVETGIINSNRAFTKDYTFNSISQAACVVIGGARNGKIVWMKNV